MKSYTTYTDKSEVFLSYQHNDRGLALRLSVYLDAMGRSVYIDVQDSTLKLGDADLDNALISAIRNSDTMVIVVSDDTQGSWWVPWEVGVSTPYQKPKAMFKLTGTPLPTYLGRLPRLMTSASVNTWVVRNILNRPT